LLESTATVSDQTPKFRLIKGGHLRFSTEHLLAIDAVLRERLQPVSRYGWVIDADGVAISTCGNPVTELTASVRDAVRQCELLLEPRKALPAAAVPLPPPDGGSCPLVLTPIDPLGVLVATCAAELSQDYRDTLLSIAEQLGPIFNDARVAPNS
jgi:hypothetical protein